MHGILDPQTWNQVVYVLNELLSTVPEMKHSGKNDWWGKLLVCWLIDLMALVFFCNTVLDDGVVFLSLHVLRMLSGCFFEKGGIQDGNF